MIRITIHVALIVALTALTQVGGLAWLAALYVQRRWIAFPLVYVALSLMAMVTAPVFGRVPVSCFRDGPLQVQGVLYCAMNRTYVAPEVLRTAEDLARHMAAVHPGTVTLVLDAGFPFLDGFPLLPHLSHGDGRQIDLAFWYKARGTYLPGVTRSPLGYFAFEAGLTACSPVWATLRWDMAWLQPLWPGYDLDTERMRTALDWLSEDARVTRVFLEPHLRKRLGVTGDKFRFQGCRAARHDDHIHFQL